MIYIVCIILYYSLVLGNSLIPTSNILVIDIIVLHITTYTCTI